MKIVERKINSRAYFVASHTKIKWVCENKRGMQEL
jgi:hypothetical protein